MTIPYQHVKKNMASWVPPAPLVGKVEKNRGDRRLARKTWMPRSMVRWVNLKKLLGHAESQLQDSDSNGPFFRCYFCCREATWLQMTCKSWLTVPVVTSMQSSNIFLGGSFNEMISLPKETKSSQGMAKLKKTNSHHHHYFQIAIFMEHFPADSRCFITPFPSNPRSVSRQSKRPR